MSAFDVAVLFCVVSICISFVIPSTLSIPTVDGTLGGRIHHELAKNIRAKTGSITGVISLSGYLTSRSGQQIYFSIIGNNAGKRRAKAIEDKICKYLLEI